MAARYGSLPFKEQIEFLERKIPTPTNGWADVYGAEHDRVFMVAGIARMDVLADLQTAINAAANEGIGLQAFRKRLRQSQQEKGWAFPGDFQRRSRLIYRTNLSSSYAAGREAQMADAGLRRLRPFKLYRSGRHFGSIDPRPEHAEWDGLVLHAEDGWWDTHSPINGWGCNCKAFLVDQATMDRLGLKLGKAPPLEEELVAIGQRSGRPRTVIVPRGIDPGFEHRPGATALGDLARLYLDRATGLPATQGALAVLGAVSRERVLGALSRAYGDWINTLDRGRPHGEFFDVGALTPQVVTQLAGRGMDLQTAIVTLRDREAAHLLRDAKDGRGQSIGLAELRRFVEVVAAPKAVLKERASDTVLLVFDPLDGDRTVKIVVRLNYATKIKTPEGRESVVTNSIRSAGRVQALTLHNAALYEILDGVL